MSTFTVIQIGFLVIQITAFIIGIMTNNIVALMIAQIPIAGAMIIFNE